MKVPYNWLKEYVDCDFSPQELADKLTMAGLEVEAIEEIAPQFNSIVVGRIEQVSKHPNADKLSLCQVTVKKDEGPLEIVCGAKNMKAGDMVPVALHGSKIKDGVTIKKTKIRNVESNGMICSEVELGIAEKSDGVMILPQEIVIGNDLDDFLKLADYVLSINVTPNRPDCLSVIGIAKEISVLTGRPLKKPQCIIEEDTEQTADYINISIEDNEGCPRYTGRMIKDVTIGPSPWNLKNKLKKVGLRSINNVVDATNYVLMEYGHPLHAFDYDLIKGQKIIVRRAQNKEKITAIDEKEYSLTDEVLCIADEKSPVAVAGIMGGKLSEVTQTTKHILLESAYFYPPRIRRGSKALNLASDSSYRFERGTDYNVLIEASDRAAYLIAQYARGKVLKGIVDIVKKEKKRLPITFRPSQCSKILGTAVEEKISFDILERFNCEIKKESESSATVMPPLSRPDLEREIDLIEEIARIYGYHKIAMRVSTGKPSPQKSSITASLGRKIRTFLSGLGLREAINYSFINRNFKDKLLLEQSDPWVKEVKIENPVNEDYAVMRPTLIHGLLTNVRLNQDKGHISTSYYELGKVYHLSQGSIRENETLSLILSGNQIEQSWYSQVQKYDFFSLKGIIESLFDYLGIKDYECKPTLKPFLHPHKGVELNLRKEVTGGILGEVSQDVLEQYDIKENVFIAELKLADLMPYITSTVKFAELAKYPAITRDIAFLADRNITHKDITDAIQRRNITILEEFHLFDVYQGGQIPEGKKSLAYSFTYRDKNKTLKDGEVAAIHDKIISVLRDELHCIIR